MRLTELDLEGVGRGFVVRMPGIVPYEDVVDFMLVDTLVSGLCFVVSSGHKAGITLKYLPEEAYLPGTGMLSVHWFRENFSTWMMPEFSPSDVEVFLHYPPAPPIGPQLN